MSGNDAPIGDDDLQAHVDGRLSGIRLAAVETYLAEHAAAAANVAVQREQRHRLKAALADKAGEPVPARLRVVHLRAARRRAWQRRLRGVAAAVGLLAVGAAGGWAAGRSTVPGSGTALGTAALAREAAVAHRVFVVETAHPVEVAASNETHLLTWLSRRLGRKLTTPDLSSFGYRLIGGRLLSGDRSAAAQLMYEDAGGQRLTVFIQAAEGTETAFRIEQDGGTTTCVWVDRGFGFAVTAPADRQTLLRIANAVYRDTGGAGGRG